MTEYDKEETYHDKCKDCGHIGMDFKNPPIDKESFSIICPKCNSTNCKPLSSFWSNE